MNKTQCQKWMAALNAAELTSYQFDTDLGTHLMNDGKNAIAIPVDEIEAVLAIRTNNLAGSHNVYANNVQAVLSDYADVHEVRTAGTSDQIKKLVETLGVTLTDEQVKIIVEIDKRNYDIKPATGDYVNRFRYLTQKQYEALSEDEKAKYDSEKKKYETDKKNYIGQNMAASITM